MFSFGQNLIKETASLLIPKCQFIAKTSSEGTNMNTAEHEEETAAGH